MGRDGIGLVLGAGGVVGQAYHAGVLGALDEVLGWDPRTADVVVGSSAGAITGTLLRLGLPAADLEAMAGGGPLSPAGAALVARVFPDQGDLPAPSAGSWLRPLRLPAPALLARVARRPWTVRPDVVAMTLLPAGRVDVRDRAASLHRMVGDHWPRRLWICAVRRDDGTRVVFGREGSPPAPLAAAVLASCAIPAYFCPVTIGGVEYFDGGVHSPTSADVLRRGAPEVVVVVSPMSAESLPGRRPDALVRWSAHRRLDREVRRLRAAGARVVRVEPSAGMLGAMGFRAMDEGRSARVAEAARAETVRRIAAGWFEALGATGSRSSP